MYGALVIDSIPPATITSWSPARIIWSAIWTARIEEAQTLLIVSDGTSIGRPAPIAAWRAGAWPAPPCSTWPMITYSTSSFAIPARSSAARMAIDPSSVASLSASEPPSLPNGVRTADTITDLVMSRAYQRVLGQSCAASSVGQTPSPVRFDQLCKKGHTLGTPVPSARDVVRTRPFGPRPGTVPSHGRDGRGAKGGGVSTRLSGPGVPSGHAVEAHDRSAP